MHKFDSRKLDAVVHGGGRYKFENAGFGLREDIPLLAMGAVGTSIRVKGITRKEKDMGLQGTKQKGVDRGEALNGNLDGAHIWVVQEICQGFYGLRRD